MKNIGIRVCVFCGSPADSKEHVFALRLCKRAGAVKFAVNAGKYNPNLVLNNGDGFKFIIQFNHLLLRIGQAPGANVTYQSWRGELPVRLYPTPAPKIPDSFAYQDIMKFEHSVILETWMDCRGNIA